MVFLDKDDFLERLYDDQDISGWNARKLLSRKSDKHFQSAAEQADKAVLVSHWRPNNAFTKSGTPSEWMPKAFENIVEMYCECSSTIATQRFLARQRHPGHLDDQRDPEQLAQQIRSFSAGYPLRLGPVIRVNTESKVDIKNVLAQLSPYFVDPV